MILPLLKKVNLRPACSMERFGTRPSCANSLIVRAELLVRTTTLSIFEHSFTWLLFAGREEDGALIKSVFMPSISIVRGLLSDENDQELTPSDDSSFRIQDFHSAHSTDSVFIRTVLAIVRALLVDARFARFTLDLSSVLAAPRTMPPELEPEPAPEFELAPDPIDETLLTSGVMSFPNFSSHLEQTIKTVFLNFSSSEKAFFNAEEHNISMGSSDFAKRESDCHTSIRTTSGPVASDLYERITTHPPDQHLNKPGVKSALTSVGSGAAALAHKLNLLNLDNQNNNNNANPDNSIDNSDDSDNDEDEFLHFAEQHLSNKSLYVNQSVINAAKLSTLISSRISQGQGETVLEIGVEDDGASMNLTESEYVEALSNLKKCANGLNCDSIVLYERKFLVLQLSNNLNASKTDLEKTNNGAKKIPDENIEQQGTISPYFYAHVLIRKRAGQVENLNELRIAVVGNVDAGKSTLLGVLTKNVLDDGRGKARVNLFKHKHELETGRTSSVGLEIMGFTSAGTVVTPESVHGLGAAGGKQKLTWDDVCTNASKVISFIDLAGHEKYLKTTVFGMTGCSPDFVMLMIGANAGIIGMTKEHLGLALALNVPVYICITKIDMCPPNVLESTIKQLTKILKSSGCRKIPMFIKTIGDVLITSGNFVSERVCPIFQISNITGEGLDLLKLFLNVLRTNSLGQYNPTAPVEYQITDTFSVPGVGTVVNGTLLNGIVHVGDNLLIGPDSAGHFTPTIVKSIQRKRVNVPLASAGQSASFALKKVKRSSLRKGMVMLSKAADAKAYFEFEAEILVLYHSTTISTKYQAMLHCGGVRQTAKIIGMDQGVLRTGDRALVQFRFMRNPEYLKIGTRLLFREGRTKGVGKVVGLGSKDRVTVQLQQDAQK
ncbi:GTP-binding protein 1 [Physocladia obscura]|uniref:GTP-binding protein 1 n=1 Tax=Physocladia obscura TaxID=109957 RepID=A0AAD5XM45_9FUNG|nr:GTP-binding protein 1 [Physocladia obscura]